MRIYRSQNFSELYCLSLMDLMQNPEYETQPRDLKIKENTNVCLILENPASCLYRNETRSSQKKYIAAELLWYFMGKNDVDFIKKYAKFWESIQNEDGTANSAYGHLLFNTVNDYGYNQYNWALTSLMKDRDSRQAVMHFNSEKHQYATNKDFVCTMYGIFQIRKDRLNLTIHMRSNDVIWGLPTDIAFFATLQSQMLVHLRQNAYPSLEMGTYTHIANSFHIYEHHFEIVEKMLETEFTPESLPMVDRDLIDATNAKPSPDFNFLHDILTNRSSNISVTIESEDELSQWIAKNIK